MKLKGLFSTVIALSFGLLVLAGYLFGYKADGTLSLLGQLQLFILNVAVILTAFVVLVGICNLLLVHMRKIRHKQKGTAYSAILVVSLTVTFLLGLTARFIPAAASLFNGAFKYIQLPIETSLMALLVVTLTLASVRLLRRRQDLLTVIFLVTAWLVMVGLAPWPFLGDVPFLSDIVRPIIAQIPGGRGSARHPAWSGSRNADHRPAHPYRL